MAELVDALDSKSSAFGHVGSSPTAPTAVMGTYKRFPVTLLRGKGCWVWDDHGHQYLDAVAGIATCALGHSDRALRRSLGQQLKQLQHVSNLYRIPEQEALAHWLVENSCADSVFFCNSGAEANEAAIKLARKHGHRRRGIDRPIILTANSSFHGRTLAAISATGQPNFHKGFEPMVEGFEFFPFNNLQAFEQQLNRLEAQGPSVAAVLIEPLQGEGGVNPGEAGFFRRLRELCSQHQILLIFDEVQVGMGRCGNWWGYQQLGIEPDAFTLAKGLGGGHAIGALLVKQHADLFEPGDHASTFGGNPFACKAALTVAKEIERRGLIAKVQQRGAQLREGLTDLVQRFPRQLKGVRGWGLLQGLVLQDESTFTAPNVAQAALEEKLLVIAAGPKVVRMVPPLIIKPSEIRQLLQRLEATLAHFR